MHMCAGMVHMHMCAEMASGDGEGGGPSRRLAGRAASLQRARRGEVYMCMRMHMCPGMDAETPDAETPDAETPDAETPDAETPDAETPHGRRLPSHGRVRRSLGAADAAHAPPERPAAHCLYSAGRLVAPPLWHMRRSPARSHSHQQGVSWAPADSHARKQAAALPGERLSHTLLSTGLPSKGLLPIGLTSKIQSLPAGLLPPPQAHQGSGSWRRQAAGCRLQAHRGSHQAVSSTALSACSADGVGELGTARRLPPQHGAAASPPPGPRH